MSRTLIEKYEALRRLSSIGVKTLRSFLVGRGDYSNLLTSLNDPGNPVYWVVRTSLEQKSLIKRPAYALDELAFIFGEIFDLEPDCKLLITELVPAIRSGIFVNESDFTYCEYVPGALQSLARDGVTPIRLLLDLNKGATLVELNVPEFYYNWRETDLRRAPGADGDLSCDESMIHRLLEIARQCPDLGTIEWVQAPNYELSAIDFKYAINGFLGSHQEIYNGLRNHRLMSLPDIWRNDTGQSDSELVAFIERPLFSYISTLSSAKATKFVFQKGGLLAHFVVECSYRSIPCMISPTQSVNRGIRLY